MSIDYYVYAASSALVSRRRLQAVLADLGFSSQLLTSTEAPAVVRDTIPVTATLVGCHCRDSAHDLLAPLLNSFDPLDLRRLLDSPHLLACHILYHTAGTYFGRLEGESFQERTLSNPPEKIAAGRRARSVYQLTTYAGRTPESADFQHCAALATACLTSGVIEDPQSGLLSWPDETLSALSPTPPRALLRKARAVRKFHEATPVPATSTLIAAALPEGGVPPPPGTPVETPAPRTQPDGMGALEPFRNLMSIPAWCPVSQAGVPIVAIAHGLYRVDDTIYACVAPISFVTGTADGGPFLTGFCWAPTLGAVLRTAHCLLEADVDQTPVLPPPGVLLFPGAVTYAQVLAAARACKFKPHPSESASYRIASDGLFVERVVHFGPTAYKFRSRRPVDTEIPYAILRPLD